MTDDRPCVTCYDLAKEVERLTGLCKTMETGLAGADAKARSALIIIAIMAKKDGGELKIPDHLSETLHPDFVVSTYRDPMSDATIFQVKEPGTPPREELDE